MKRSALELLFGGMYAGTGTPTQSPRESLLTRSRQEVALYKGETVLAMSESPLVWWRLNAHKYPLLSVAARQALVVQATSVSSERIFSVAGDLVSAKRSCLEAENINSIIFVNKNYFLLDNLDSITIDSE